jgi:radical SAM-linked protein
VDRPPEDSGRGSVEPRQRWRLVLRRSPDAPRPPQRETLDAFDAALAASGLPLVTAGRSRSRMAFGAPLAAGMPAERELADLVLGARVPVAALRDRLSTGLPAGWQLVDAYDVWLGEPSLVSQVVAAEYQVTVESADPDGLALAAVALLRAGSLPREREKGGGTVAYDLRPLVDSVSVDTNAGPGPDEGRVTLRVRTRMHPELGTGRPEEVVAALGDELGRELVVRSIARARLILVGETGV